ncbi:hypothetical protein PsorP6_011752 [Peronosclerospora sorghi]|uniref:Uncharacterized protein n=1 Tax=Peronosclerospora sorghi TaxID=230839 RepID=A0ACC0WJG3_9STRA|nr:hypothetical protein PsorP6_011752 [Peronosclerospora sorghi]
MILRPIPPYVALTTLTATNRSVDVAIPKCLCILLPFHTACNVQFHDCFRMKLMSRCLNRKCSVNFKPHGTKATNFVSVDKILCAGYNIRHAS